MTFDSSPALKRQGFFFGISNVEWILSLIVFISLAGLFFSGLINGDKTISGADPAIFFIPFRQTWVDLALQGYLPLWDPFTASGNPLFATLQGAILYPFSIFFLFLEFFQAFNLILIMHYALAGFFMYWLLRASRCSRTGSAIGALAFMFGGYLFSLRFYLSTLFPVVWSPLLILSFFGGMLRNDLRLALVSAIISVFMIFAGGAETCYQLFAWMIFFSIFPVTLFPDIPMPSLKNRMVYLGLFFILFFGFSAVQFLPTMELVENSLRSKSFEINTASHWNLQSRDLFQFILLDPFGYHAFQNETGDRQTWLQSQYTGAIPLLLAGFFFLKGGIRAWTLILIVVVSWALATGQDSILYRFFFETLPYFDKFRYPVKFLLPIILIISIASAFGWDRLRQTKPEKKLKAILLSLATLCMVGFGGIDLFFLPLQEWMSANGFLPPAYSKTEINLGNLQRLFGLTSLFSLFLYLHLRKNQTSSAWILMAVSIFFLDIFFSNHGNLKMMSSKPMESNLPTTQFLMRDKNLFRVFVTKNTEHPLVNSPVKRDFRGVELKGKEFPVEFRNQNRVQQLGGWNIIRKTNSINFIGRVSNGPLTSNLPSLRMANVKYIVHGGPGPLENLPLAFEEPPEYRRQLEKNNEHPPPLLRVYENPGYLGRAFLAGQCVVLPDGPQLNNAIIDTRWDPEQWVILPESPLDLPCVLPGDGAKKGEGTVQITHWKSEEGAQDLAPGEYRMQVNSARRQFLVLSDSFYPGWEAFIDGEQVTIHRANQAFRAIVMPEGKHVVEFRYRPKSFLYGAWISGITVIAGVAFVVVSTQRRRKEEITKE